MIDRSCEFAGKQQFQLEYFQKYPTFAPVQKKGPVAEWLGRALQKLVHQFESGRDLKQKDHLVVILLPF